MKKDSIWRSLGLILLYLIVTVVVSALFSLIEVDNIYLKNITLLISVLIPGAFVVYRLKDKLDGSFEDYKKNFKKNIKIILKYWLIGFVLMLLSNLVINYLIMGGIAPNEEANREVLELYPLYSIIDVVFIAPFVEELLFRLNFKGVFKERTTYVLASGLLFGFAHVMLSCSSLMDLIYMIPYSILGISFAMIAYDTDNVLSSVTAHMLHNALSILIIFSGI